MLGPRENVLFNNIIAIAGQVVGTWKRTIKPTTVTVEPRWFRPPTVGETALFVAGAKRYAAFLGVTLASAAPQHTALTGDAPRRTHTT